MADSFILVHDPSWAGPVVNKTAGPNVDLTQASIETVEEPLKYVLEVDQQAKNPTNHPPLDYQCEASAGQPLFSAKFRDALEGAGVDNVQYFPAEVVYEPTGEKCDYMAANVVGIADVLDVDASGCDVDDAGFVMGFEKMVFREEALAGLHFVRLINMMSIIILSDRVATRLKAAELTGVRILPPSEWIPGMM